MATNLNTYTRKKWRAKGYHVEGVESFAMLPGGLPRKSDLFGFVDFVAVPLEPSDPWVYIQTTSRSNVSARVRKILEGDTGTGQWAIPMRTLAQAILDHGDLLLVEGWSKQKGRYTDRERWITKEDLSNAL